SYTCPHPPPPSPYFVFFLAPPPSAIYPLSLHDALPISPRMPVSQSWTSATRGVDRAAAARGAARSSKGASAAPSEPPPGFVARADRKSTRLNSSHDQISYAVFCLKKKKKNKAETKEEQD